MTNDPQHNEMNIRTAESRHPTVAIVGRPNVGKSALFNVLVRRRMAIVHEQSGVTRDRVAAMAEHRDRRFLVIDTGGLGLYRDEQKGDNVWDELIREQLTVAVESACRVILVTDVRDGVMALDREVADLLRESGKSVVIAANKADNQALEDGAGVFAELGFGAAFPTSCTQQRGITELLDAVTADFPAEDELPAEPPLRITVVGRPNVGKSSIINRLLGEDRVIVSDIPGTTRDAVDIPLTLETEAGSIAAELIDTAGMRRRGKVDSVVEYFSMGRTENAIKRADVVLVVLDATSPATAQDRRICRMVADAGKACLILLNKWDLASAAIKQKDLLEEVGRLLPFMDFVDAMTCCAVSGYNLKFLMPRILQLREQLEVEFPTSLVNRVVRDAVLRLPPPRGSKGPLKVYYAVCVSNKPPTFLLFVNDKARAYENYVQYLRHQFIRAFGIRGIPVVVRLKNRRQGDPVGGDGGDTTTPARSRRKPSARGGKQRVGKSGKPPKGRPKAKGRKQTDPKRKPGRTKKKRPSKRRKRQ